MSRPIPRPALAGNPPPPDAPREVSQPLTPEAIAEQLAKAQAHAGHVSPVAQATEAGVKVSELGGEIARRPRPAVPVAVTPTPEMIAAAEVAGEPAKASTTPGQPGAEPAAAVPPSTIEPLADVTPHAPAASNTDSPSRGQPKPIADPNLQITGGFGLPPAAGAASQPEEARAGGGFGLGGSEYLALDGSELKELILHEMDGLAGELQQDLRLTLALTYPLAAVTLSVKVECDQPDRTFTITRQFREAQGQPPDLVRERLGLELPHKQGVPTPGGLMVVDRLT